MKKFVTLLLALAMILSLAACGNSNANQAPTPSTSAPNNSSATAPAAPNSGVKYADTVTVGFLTDLETADPYGGTSAATHFFTNSSHQYLVELNPDSGELECILAESYEDPVGDGMQWRVHLRQGIKSHDGADFNADDVVFTWNYAKDINNVVKVIANADAMVKEVVAEDPNTVLFKLNYCIPDFPAYLEIKIYSKEAFDTMPKKDAAIIGTGPYKVGEITPGVRYCLERFDDYWGGIDMYPTKNIVVKWFADANTLSAALQADEVDYCFALPSAQYNELSMAPNLNILQRAGTQSFYLGFNYKKAAWNNVENRQAFAMALNKPEIIDIYWEGGIGATQNENFCIPSGSGYKEGIVPLPYDPEKAAEIFKKNGVSSVILMVPTYKKVQAEIIQSQLEAVGVKAQIDQVDDTNWLTLRAEYDYDIYCGDYGNYGGATLLYNFSRFLSKDGPSNVSGMNIPEWEALMEETRQQSTYEGVAEVFGRMQQWVATNVPLVPLAINNVTAYAQKDVGGIKLGTSDNTQHLETLYRIVK